MKPSSPPQSEGIMPFLLEGPWCSTCVTFRLSSRHLYPWDGEDLGVGSNHIITNCMVPSTGKVEGQRLRVKPHRTAKIQSCSSYFFGGRFESDGTCLHHDLPALHTHMPARCAGRQSLSGPSVCWTSYMVSAQVSNSFMSSSSSSFFLAM